MPKKTIFITVPEASAARNVLRGSFWNYINAERNFRIVLVTASLKKEQYAKEFFGKDITVEELPYVAPGFLEKALAFISRNAFQTGTTTFNQMRQRHDGGSFLALMFKRFLWHAFGRSKTIQVLVRRIELMRKQLPTVRALFDRYGPDLLFSTVAIHPEIDVAMLREAKRRKIPTIAMLRGWDNFTSHGFLRVVPDRMLLQNEYLKRMGMTYHFLMPEMFEVVGFPQNDWYFRNEWILPRDAFLQKLGIDPKKRMILFGAMGDFLFPKEGEIADVFEALVESKKIPQDLVMVFRAHPAFQSPLERMKSFRHVIPDRNAVYLSSQVDSWEMGEEEMKHLVNSIVHSEMVITSGSTMALDAVALGKPALSAAFEKTRVNYWISARRFRHHYTHYEAMMATGGVRAADSEGALAEAINAYLENPRKDADGRTCLIKEFLAPYEGDSGKRIADAVHTLIQK